MTKLWSHQPLPMLADNEFCKAMEYTGLFEPTLEVSGSILVRFGAGGAFGSSSGFRGRSGGLSGSLRYIGRPLDSLDLVVLSNLDNAPYKTIVIRPLSPIHTKSVMSRRSRFSIGPTCEHQPTAVPTSLLCRPNAITVYSLSGHGQSWVFPGIPCVLSVDATDRKQHDVTTGYFRCKAWVSRAQLIEEECPSPLDQGTGQNRVAAGTLPAGWEFTQRSGYLG